MNISTQSIKDLAAESDPAAERLLAWADTNRDGELTGLGEECNHDNPQKAQPPVKPTPAKPIRSNTEPSPSIEQICWQLQKQIRDADNVESFLRDFVNIWCRTLAADQVVALVRKTNANPKRFKTTAVSGMDSFDHASPTLTQLESICEAHSQASETIFWNQVLTADSDTCPLLSGYARSNGFQSVLLFSVLDPKSPEPSVLLRIAVFANTPRLHKSHVQPISDELFPSIARQTLLLTQAEGNWLSRFLMRFHEYFFRSRGRLWGVISFILILALLFPMPHRLSCKSYLQPTVRRYIASPFAGRLEKSFVLPGDVVESEQLLAKMDDADLILQLESAIAERAREKERHDSALSDGKISEAQIAKLEMEKLAYDIDFFRAQLKQLEIRSPIDGVIVSGDLEKAEGAPVETGQTLYEVGPVDIFSAEIEVSERDIRFLKVGQDAIIRFNAVPLETFCGKIERIYPKAEVRDDEAVFVAIAQIDNSDQKLKPGMEGTATIETGPSTIGWNLFHRPVENIRSYFGS